MKYKVGDRVKMRSLQWCKENIFNNEDKYQPELFEGIEKFCGKILTISDAVDKSKNVDEGYYNMLEDTKWDYYWTDEMIEGLAEEETKPNIIVETKYPKTYKECVKVLLDKASVRNDFGYKGKLLVALQKLLVCRDAYWKIAGEEMGLRKPWEPDYDSGVNKYGIICMNGVVQKSNPTTNWERHLNKVLDFPTEEMRDAFYKNFNELIEQCKELL